MNNSYILASSSLPLFTLMDILNRIVPAIPAGMGTGAHEDRFACDRKCQAKACVRRSHATVGPNGQIPIPAVNGRSYLFHKDSARELYILFSL